MSISPVNLLKTIGLTGINKKKEKKHQQNIQSAPHAGRAGCKAQIPLVRLVADDLLYSKLRKKSKHPYNKSTTNSQQIEPMESEPKSDPKKSCQLPNREGRYHCSSYTDQGVTDNSLSTTPCGLLDKSSRGPWHRPPTATYGADAFSFLSATNVASVILFSKEPCSFWQRKKYSFI